MQFKEKVLGPSSEGHKLITREIIRELPPALHLKDGKFALPSHGLHYNFVRLHEDPSVGV